MNRKTKKQITIVVVAVFFLSAGLWYAYHTKTLDFSQKENTELTGVLSGGMENEPSVPEPTPSEEQEKEELVVYICGAVNVPGIYTLTEGSRLHEVITLAGGFSAEADTDYHNLARNVEDGERIYIVSYAETKELTIEQQVVGEEGEQKETSLINLNTATAEQLTSLPGIGASKAESILAYRRQVGQFADIEEIKNVSGIGDAMFAKIKDKITIR